VLPKHSPSFITGSLQISKELVPLSLGESDSSCLPHLEAGDLCSTHLQKKEGEKKGDFWGG